MRAALRATAVYNVGGAILFAFPGSAAGQLAGLPASAPVSYRALLATFALLFGGMYGWLAQQPVIHRGRSRRVVGLAAVVVRLGVLALGGSGRSEFGRSETQPSFLASLTILHVCDMLAVHVPLDDVAGARLHRMFRARSARDGE